jgi:ABC-type bacteriocin/lantibiotic exporter with double-glycine peptidase domain
VNSAPVLLLDKPTCALDAENDLGGRRSIAGRTSRTTIVIAHRLAVVQKTDRIVVIGSGLIVEQVCIRTSREAPVSMPRSQCRKIGRAHGEDGKVASLILATEWA